MARKVALYATPTVADGRELVVIESAAGATVSVSACVLLAGVVAESRTWTVKLNVPGVVGVPDITPVFEFRVTPAGSAPLEIDQV